MLSRSAIVKLKAILIIDLIVIAAAAGAYFYLLNEGAITGASRPATFALSAFTVSPQEAYVGDTIQITANVTNTGDVIGNDTFNFEVNGIVKDTTNLTLASGDSQEIDFSAVENAAGNYTIKISSISTDNSISGYFVLTEPPPESSKIVLSSFKSTPYEGWPDTPITITATAQNPSTEADRLMVRVTVDNAVVNSTVLELAAGASQTIEFTVNATAEGKHAVKLNSLTGSFTIVKEGYHTLTINRSGGGSKSLPFTLNGEDHGTPYQALLPVGEYSISVPTPYNVGTGVLEFTAWSDGVLSSSRTFSLESRLILVCTYTLISGYASCPSLYIWNGTGYSYVTDVSNSGWLGYIGYMNSDGTVIFKGGNPYDYVKLDKNLLATNNGNFDMTLSQQWNELYYLDQAYMLVVDHPVGTDAYMSMTSYLSDGSTGKVYTVNSQNIQSPISATNEKGQNVLPQLLTKDGLYTPGINGYDSVWNNITLNQLTLDLGNLTGAPEIKLVIKGMVDWGSADSYYKWIDSFKDAAAKGLVSNGTEITPAPYLEVKAANGSWIRISQDVPLPSDYNSRTYTVDLTGIFPADITDYQIRFNNYWNVTYDYIGIDTTPQANVTLQTIAPESASLSQLWESQATSSGAFTRYGDVTPLLQSADDMYVIGRQGDQVNMQFSTANLAPVAQGMERDYFFVVACWFKDPEGAWGYGFHFTTDPMPFLNMSGFPYTTAESYPTNAAHLAYIQEYNTRIIPPT
jgi:hypothetical protein